LRIVFAGTPVNAAKTLEALVDAGHTVVGVLTRADAATGRAKTVTESPVAATASLLKIPVLKSNKVDEAVLDWISALRPDLGVIVAYGCILKADALAIPRNGWVNLHYSLLPIYPGASPVQQALLDGATSTGVSVFELDEGVDSGPILSTQLVAISAEDNAGTLLKRLTEAGAELLMKTLNNYDELHSSRQLQGLESGRSVTRKITRSHAKLDFSASAQEVLNMVRAMNPEPVAWFEMDTQPVRVLEAALVESHALTVGMAKLVGSDLVVGCAHGSVALKKVQPAGKTEMAGADWFRGLRKDLLLLS
jgi:methionyl-tRNA formyltransferase